MHKKKLLRLRSSFFCLQPSVRTALYLTHMQAKEGNRSASLHVHARYVTYL